MNKLKRQGELFDDNDLLSQPVKTSNEVFLSKAVLQKWQKAIYTHQEQLFQGLSDDESQGSLFHPLQDKSLEPILNPLDLTPLPINFWRWSQSDHTGPAIYLVMDRPKGIGSNLLLYIGETMAAEKRWKGDHDCKKYLEAYLEAFQKANLETQLSIRFWTDVPKATKARRKIEQQLIQTWLPPFNKETRSRWATPFTTENYSFQ